MKYSCIIIDDDPSSHIVLKDYLSKISEVQLIGAFFNAKDASRYLKSHSTDFMILDVQMPEITGFDFVKSMTIAKPIGIISTANQSNALQKFEFGVIDNLLKPIHFERFDTVIRRMIDFLNLAKIDQSSASRRRSSFEILIKTGTKRVLIDYRKINFAKGLKDYTVLHTDEAKYIVKGCIKSFEDYLPNDHFLRVHKSFIVAMPKIKIVRRNKIELDAISIPIGRHFKRKISGLLCLGKGEEMNALHAC